MKMYKAIIVDDESKIRKVLQIKLEKYCQDIEIVAHATDALEAYQQILLYRPHIVFLDISMPSESGFDLLNRFDKIAFEIIFVTGNDEHVLDALRISAVDYLLKPIHTGKLVNAVKKAKENVKNRKKIELYDTLRHNIRYTGAQESKLAIPVGDSNEYVQVGDIIRCEGWQKYTRIYLKDGSDLISSYHIGVYNNMLKCYGFYNIHKSHLINTKMIVRYLKKGTVIMIDESEVPVARRRREEFIRDVLDDLFD